MICCYNTLQFLRFIAVDFPRMIAGLPRSIYNNPRFFCKIFVISILIWCVIYFSLIYILRATVSENEEKEKPKILFTFGRRNLLNTDIELDKSHDQTLYDETLTFSQRNVMDVPTLKLLVSILMMMWIGFLVFCGWIDRWTSQHNLEA